MTIALWIIGYLVVGLALAKVAVILEDIDEIDQDSAIMLATIVLGWPLWIVGGLIAGLVLSVKHFLLWNPGAWNAARKTRKMEKDLERGE
jgi:hypothetical protein